MDVTGDLESYFAHGGLKDTGSIETGTHVLFAGTVVEAETTTSRSPLLWQRHRYHGLSGLD